MHSSIPRASFSMSDIGNDLVTQEEACWGLHFQIFSSQTSDVAFQTVLRKLFAK